MSEVVILGRLFCWRWVILRRLFCWRRVIPYAFSRLSAATRRYNKLIINPIPLKM